MAEDDIDFGNMLRQYLELNSFEVCQTFDGIEAYEKITTSSFDLCVLDVMMPKMDGFTLAKKIRKELPHMPIIFLTARHQKADRIQGLQLGADDYITKPFEADELVLRIQNLLKRTISTTPFTPLVTIGNYTFDSKKLSLQSPTKTHRLTERETALLQYLVQHKNEIVSKDAILKALWKESDFFSRRSLDVFISRLRKYLKEDEAVQIESLRGVGIIFKVD